MDPRLTNKEVRRTMKNLLTLALMFALVSPVFASTRVLIPANTWTQLSASPTFSMQSLCNYTLFIQPSNASPAPADVGVNAFQVTKRAIWDQGIATTDTWWALSQVECAVIVEDHS